MPITKATANVVDFASPTSQIIAIPGDNLATKYAQAKTLTPQGNALSSTNRATLIIYPGTYTLSTTLTIDAEFVDIYGVGSQRWSPVVFFTGASINVSANDINVTGIGSNSASLRTTGSKPLSHFENCSGVSESFGYGIGNPASGTYIGCYVFGNGGCFGTFAAADGRFVDCRVIGTSAFASGTSADAAQIASGIFDRCSAQSQSFGWGGGFSGTAYNCQGSTNAFGATPVSGSTGISGTLYNCVGGANSFGGGTALGTRITGRLYYCRLTSGTFQTVTSPGITRLCIDGSNVENNQG